MNKKGNLGFMIMFIILVAMIMTAGLFVAVGVSVTNMVTDAVVPEIKGIGMVGSSNVTEISGYVLDPLQSVINQFSWVGGVMYFMSIILLFGTSIAFKITLKRWLVGAFFILALLIIFVSIIISNIYEDLYQDSTEFGDGLRDQVILSYLLLHSPVIFTVVIFLSGIILFSGMAEEEYL